MTGPASNKASNKASNMATLRSEWTKVRTVWSTPAALLPTVVLGTGLGGLVSLSFRSARSLPSGEIDPVFASFYGLTIAQLGLIVFGIMLVGSEYSSGTIRASLVATPQRFRFYASKVAVGALLAGATSLVTVVSTYLVAQAVLGPYRLSLTEGEGLRAVTGAWIYLTLICLFAIGVTAILRSQVLSLAILVPVLFLSSQGLGNIPGIRTVTQFLPDQAGTMILHTAGPPDDLAFPRAYGPWTGLGILLLWTATALAGGYLVLRRRDA